MGMHGQDKLFQTKSIVKTTNPKWDEHFSVHIDNPFKAITLQVYDKDLVGSDDFMGEATIDLTDLNLKKTQDFQLALGDANNEDLIKIKNKKRKTLGTIHLKVTLSPITKEEMNEFILNSEEFAHEPVIKRLSVASRGGGISPVPGDGEIEEDI